MQHKYRVAITVAMSTARELGRPLFVVCDCVDGEMYAVSEDSRAVGFLTAEVYALAHPDGRLTFNDNYVETYHDAR